LNFRRKIKDVTVGVGKEALSPQL